MSDPRSKKPKDVQASDLRPDAWERFKAAVHDMARAGPQHRTKAVKAEIGKARPKRGKSPAKRKDTEKPER